VPAALLTGAWSRGRRAAAGLALALAACAASACGAGATPAAAPPPTITVATRNVTSTQPPYTAKLTLPELDWPGHAAAAARVNAAVQAWAQAQVTAFGAEVATDLAHERGLPASLPNSTLTLAYRSGYAGPGAVSFAFLLEPYPRGAANFGQNPAGLTFALPSGRRLALAALFQPGSAYLTTLAAQAGSGLQAFHPAGARCYLGHEPPATGASFGAWWLSQAGLVLSFPAGTYTAAYCGAPQITVPYPALRPLAAPGSILAGA
jgi:hypothetical protein